MKAFLNRVPAWAEFAIVAGGAFGYFVMTSLFVAVDPVLMAKPHHTNTTLIALGIYEVIILGVLVAFLSARGWTAARVGLRPTLSDTGMGIALAFTAYLGYFVAFFGLAILVPGFAEKAQQVNVVAQGIALPTALVVPWINALYEELFVAGYVITALKDKRGVWFAINVSVALRLAYHLYQGPLGVAVAIPLGLVFGFWYARNGKLWPLIVGHAAIDLLGMLTKVQWS